MNSTSVGDKSADDDLHPDVPEKSSTASTSSPAEDALHQSLDESIVSEASSSSHPSSVNTSTSLVLNPNSTMDNEDLPGIALLKEIFPQESTESLRELHYHHIMVNKTQSMSQKSSPSETHRSNEYGDEDASSTRSPYNENTSNATGSKLLLQSSQAGGNNESHEDFHCASEQRRGVLNVPKIELPDDFLRLPTSVAVVRPLPSFNGQSDLVYQPSRYEFISDLETRALQEYQLVRAANGGNLSKESVNGEYKTFVVQRDDRWGLGMTLQEEEESLKRAPPEISSLSNSQSLAARYGLRVVGFLPDPNKIKRGEIISAIATSPAERAGVLLDDVLIGINGEAFLLPPLTASLSNRELGIHYKNQKAKIVQSIQHSPNPVVLHIRRQKPVIDTKTTGDRQISLLDTTIQDVEDDPTLMQQVAVKECLSPPALPNFRPQNSLHPLADQLVKRKLILSRDDQWRVTFRLHQFTERTRQWEASNALRLSSDSSALIPYFDPNDLPPDMASLMFFTQSNEQESRNTTKAVDIDDQESSLSTNDLQRYISKQYEAFWGAECTPSTPPLPVDSPLIPFEYLQAFYGDEQARKLRSSSSKVRSASNGFGQHESLSSPKGDGLPAARSLFQRRQTWSQSQNNGLYPGKTYRQHDQTNGYPREVSWIPLYGIRKSLSARIVNCFVEERRPDSGSGPEDSPRMAYAMWVYDTESGREWYAPVRYWKDFCDLREAAMGLLPPSSTMHKELLSIKFPKEVTIPRSNGLWNTAMFSGSSPLSPLQDRRRKRQIEEFEDAREQSTRALEEFLRELLGAIYTCQPLHPNVSEIALYVQSFLGVDSGLAEESTPFVGSSAFKDEKEIEEEATRQLLKRSIQRYTWRVFLLHTMKAIVRDFVDSARARGPKLQDIEALEAQGRASLKSRAIQELDRIQAFLDHLVDLILEGCGSDLRMIAQRHEYKCIHKFFSKESYWDRLARESVREQVEIEVYVPLRSVVSRLLVNGWRHEDMEAHFKIKELRKRPQVLFRIPEDKISPSNWQSVAQILKQGVGMSTLPSVKLRAIVEAAREISRLYGREHGDGQVLGADDLLPIFIFSVVRAEMERPCALCILLRTLCDKSNRIGEIGYFLASFEATISHIQEIDLTEDHEEVLSSFSDSLTEVPLND